MKPLPLDVPVPIADLARHAKMRTERMRRNLFRLRRKCPACGEQTVTNDGTCADLQKQEGGIRTRGCGDTSSGPGLLICVSSGTARAKGYRWKVRSINALREFWPDFGKQFWVAKDAETVAAETKVLKRQLRAAQKRLRETEAIIQVLLPALRALEPFLKTQGVEVELPDLAGEAQGDRLPWSPDDDEDEASAE